MKAILKPIAAVALLAFGFSAHGQTVVSGSFISISTPGSYLLSGTSNTILIGTSDVTLDLGGNSVLGSASCSLINNGQAQGCQCSTPNCQTMQSGIKVSGNNVVIRHGRVEHQAGDGISVFVSPGSPVPGSIVLEDLTLDNNTGNGAVVGIGGAQLKDLRVYQNGQNGIQLLGDSNRLEHISSSYNNGSGVNSVIASNEYSDVLTTWNRNFGLLGNGTLTRVAARNNGFAGILTQGLLRDSSAESNGNDGVVFTGHGLVVDSSSANNQGNGFSFGADTCYSRLSTFGNGAGTIAGGVPLTDYVTACN
jgi:hypothetical protein